MTSIHSATIVATEDPHASKVHTSRMSLAAFLNTVVAKAISRDPWMLARPSLLAPTPDRLLLQYYSAKFSTTVLLNLVCGKLRRSCIQTPKFNKLYVLVRSAKF